MNNKKNDYSLLDIYIFKDYLNKLHLRNSYNIENYNKNFEIWYYNVFFIKNLRLTEFNNNNYIKQLFVDLAKAELKMCKNIKISSNIKKSKKIFVQKLEDINDS